MRRDMRCIKRVVQSHNRGMVPTAQGKQGKLPQKSPCLGKHREFGNFAKTQGILFAQVVDFLFLKVKDILIFATKISTFFLKLGMSAKSVLLCNSQKSRKLAQGKFALSQENTGNLKIQFEWVPWTDYFLEQRLPMNRVWVDLSEGHVLPQTVRCL